VTVATQAELIQMGLPIVDAVARRLARRLGRCVPFEDLLSIGQLALLELVHTYDPARSAFPRFATVRLKWAILDGVRRETHGRSSAARVLAVIAAERYGEGADPEPDGPTTQEEDVLALRQLLDGQTAAMATALLATRPDPELSGVETPEDQLARAQSMRAAREAVAALPQHQRALVERHYYGGEPFEAIAKDLAISKSWASRQHDRAMRALSHMVRGEPSRDAEERE
jgi:RNA polymerase sigma factor for flagellar operon FliA